MDCRYNIGLLGYAPYNRGNSEKLIKILFYIYFVDFCVKQTGTIRNKSSQVLNWQSGANIIFVMLCKEERCNETAPQCSKLNII